MKSHARRAAFLLVLAILVTILLVPLPASAAANCSKTFNAAGDSISRSCIFTNKGVGKILAGEVAAVSSGGIGVFVEVRITNISSGTDLVVCHLFVPVVPGAATRCQGKAPSFVPAGSLLLCRVRASHTPVTAKRLIGVFRCVSNSPV